MANKASKFIANETVFQNSLRTSKFKIETRDAGWWQIRMALNEQNLAEELLTTLKDKHNLLKAKILPQLSEYGII